MTRTLSHSRQNTIAINLAMVFINVELPFIKLSLKIQTIPWMLN